MGNWVWVRWACSVPPLQFFCQLEMVLVEINIASREKPSESMEDRNSSGSLADMSDTCRAVPWPHHGAQSFQMRMELLSG